jgi:Fungal N-terminal domain of STAND proteins
MDPLSAIGLAANVAGLVSLVIEVSHLVADYFASIKNMSTNMKVLREELTALQHVLEQLSSLLHGSGAAGKFFQKSSVLYLTIASCTGDVQEMAVKLKSSKNIVARTVQKLHWPFEEKEVSKFNDRLRKHISIYQFSLTMENWYLSLTIVEKLD